MNNVKINDKYEQGFTLLEVLVALVVLSIGLLGIAGLHIDGVRSGLTALQRTYAVNLASDMADRIRANPNGNYDLGAGPPGEAPGQACADTHGGGEAPNDCTPDVMAVYDVWEWRSALDATATNGLPGGQGAIVLDTNTSPNAWVITVTWTDKGDQQSYRLTVQQ